MMHRVILAGAIAVLALVSIGCGDGALPVNNDARPLWLFDAGLPDAPWPDDATPADACPYTMCIYTCADLTSDPHYCGDCDTECSPAAGCIESECTCPSGFLPDSLADLDPPPSFSTNNLPTVSVRASFTGNDDLTHQLRVSWDNDAVETGVDYDLSEVTTPSVRISYHRGFELPRGTFLPSAGTLNLSRACTDGVAGTLTDLSLYEVEGWGSDPVEDGCVLEVTSLSFDFGGDCVATK